MHRGSYQKWAALPESLGRLRALRTLDLGRSVPLKLLPKSFRQLRALQALDLGKYESLKALPEGLRVWSVNMWG